MEASPVFGLYMRFKMALSFKYPSHIPSAFPFDLLVLYYVSREIIQGQRIYMY